MEDSSWVYQDSGAKHLMYAGSKVYMIAGCESWWWEDKGWRCCVGYRIMQLAFRGSRMTDGFVTFESLHDVHGCYMVRILRLRDIGLAGHGGERRGGLLWRPVGQAWFTQPWECTAR